MQVIKGTDTEYRKITGTKLINPTTGKIIYTPPDPNYIPDLMFGWEAFVNEVNDDIDPLIKMALMHYQFEAIHPFLMVMGELAEY